jgi:3-dehydroquinate dehydratase-2
MTNILVLNGPNINLLGQREPNHYGKRTLTEIIEELEQLADDFEVRLFHFQSNAEHALIERVHAALDEDIDFIIINPAAFTHTSIALRDALAGVKIPFIEVHLSNVHKREAFRHHSYFSDLAVGTIVGLGPIGYALALQSALDYLDNN